MGICNEGEKMDTPIPKLIIVGERIKGGERKNRMG